MGCHLPNPSHACACGREVWPSHFTLPHLQDLRLGEAQVASEAEPNGRQRAIAAANRRRSRGRQQSSTPQRGVDNLERFNSGQGPDRLYKGLEAMCYAMMQDLHLDLQLEVGALFSWSPHSLDNNLQISIVLGFLGSPLNCCPLILPIRRPFPASPLVSA